MVRDGEYVHVALGSLVDDPSIRPTHHIFVGSKAPWFEITDDLPQFEEHATMSASPANVGAITLFVDDPARSKAFYEQAFGLTAIFEDESSVAFKFENTIVNLLARPAARELIEPATVAAPGAGSSFQLTIWVDDADAACAELALARREPGQRPDRPRVGDAHGLLRRSRRAHLGGRAGARRLGGGSPGLGREDEP